MDIDLHGRRKRRAEIRQSDNHRENPLLDPMIRDFLESAMITPCPQVHQLTTNPYFCYTCGSKFGGPAVFSPTGRKYENRIL